MSRVQLALNVSDLDDAVAFYSKLFATEPAKVRPGYANFAIAEPPLKLVLIEGHGEPGTLNHLGVEVESTDEVGAAAGPARRPRAWRPRPRTRSTCCYAVQDKVWVDGPDGEPWEIYTVLADVEMPPGELRTVAPGDDAMCCADGAGVRRRAAADAAMDRDLARRATAEPSAPRSSSRSSSAPASRAAALARRRRAAAARELDRDRRRARRADPGLRAGLGRALQPGRHLADRILGGTTTSRRVRLRRRPGRRRVRRRDRRQPDVRPPRRRHSRPTRVRRSGLWLGEVVATFGLLLVIFGVVRAGRRVGGAVRRRRLHRGGVLVHVVDQLRQPRGHDRPHAHQHLRRHRAEQRPDVHRRSRWSARWSPSRSRVFLFPTSRRPISSFRTNSTRQAS